MSSVVERAKLRPRKKPVVRVEPVDLPKPRKAGKRKTPEEIRESRRLRNKRYAARKKAEKAEVTAPLLAEAEPPVASPPAADSAKDSKLKSFVADLHKVLLILLTP